ncbi:hypothetical protein BS47DRAFT_1398088 [Hydnum rufescens UP504]|uniref:Uncharacterized protein n=1 Tax=Hydnum rufescens UP504 TaxID=1448309 RepID=A0A9P6DR63_9AGAM|nr:hypothetical protein BS47DRAFT_1398088 [Hydnum rufescens UP504]
MVVCEPKTRQTKRHDPTTRPNDTAQRRDPMTRPNDATQRRDTTRRETNDTKPNNTKPSDPKPSDPKPSDLNPATRKPSDAKPSGTKPNETTLSQPSPNENARGGDTSPKSSCSTSMREPTDPRAQINPRAYKYTTNKTRAYETTDQKSRRMGHTPAAADPESADVPTKTRCNPGPQPERHAANENRERNPARPHERKPRTKLRAPVMNENHEHPLDGLSKKYVMAFEASLFDKEVVIESYSSYFDWDISTASN